MRDVRIIRNDEFEVKCCCGRRNLDVNSILNADDTCVRSKQYSETYRVQAGSEAHQASFPMGTGGSFTEDKAAGP
jgi:hypothetical protein